MKAELYHKMECYFISENKDYQLLPLESGQFHIYYGESDSPILGVMYSNNKKMSKFVEEDKSKLLKIIELIKKNLK